MTFEEIRFTNVKRLKIKITEPSARVDIDVDTCAMRYSLLNFITHNFAIIYLMVVSFFLSFSFCFSHSFCITQ